ncbi:hypothetical protein SLA2020_153730 [Shorea laevis]
MGWNYPDISFEQLMKLTKGFVDILILASGYQSSGLPAHWDADNISRAFHWALFFENVVTHLCNVDIYQDSVEELDAALFEMTSDPSFPQGLAHLSSATLRRARGFILEHFIQNLPLRETHLRAVLTAAIEMDLSDLSETQHDNLSAYLNKLTLQNTSVKQVQHRSSGMKDSIMSSQDEPPTNENEKCSGDDFTPLAIQELIRRQHAVSCISTTEAVLDTVSNAANCSICKSDFILLGEQLKHDSQLAFMGSEETSIDIFTWNQWKSRALSYFIDKKTIRLVSGASLIFSGSKNQWVQVFQQLNISDGNRTDNLLEMVELLLLGCIASRWNSLVEYLMSVSYDSLPVSNQYYLLCNFVFGRSLNFPQKEDSMNSKECGILDHLTGLIGGQLHLLWKISPILVAVSIPSWSPLFRFYLSEIESQVKGDPSIKRCWSCGQEKGHKDCELAEKIWCLYIFHVCGSQIIHNGSGA